MAQQNRVFLTQTNLTGINKATLSMLVDNELSGVDAKAFTLSKASPGSGYSIGLAQVDSTGRPAAFKFTHPACIGQLDIPVLLLPVAGRRPE